MKYKKTLLIIILVFLCINAITINFYTKNSFEKTIKDTYYTIIKKIKGLRTNITFTTIDTNNEIKDLQEEIDRLKNTLDLNKTISNHNYVNTTLISRDSNYWYNTVVVDKGTKDGIKVNRAAVIKEGLIGKVIETTKNTSTIELLTTSNYQNKISVKINSNSDVFGLITSYDHNTNTYQVEDIDAGSEIKVGDLVYTTGLSEIYPSGILIGTVKEITYDNFELTKSIKVTPSVNFNNIPYITIIK